MRIMRKVSQVLAALFFLASGIGPIAVQPQVVQADGGAFPESSWNGMQIAYDLAGATLGPPEDTSVENKYNEKDPVRQYESGKVTGEAVTITGTATRSARDYRCRTWVEIDLRGIPQSESAWIWKQGSLDQTVTEAGQPFSQAFSASIPIVPGSEGIAFEVRLLDFCAEGPSRIVYVKGSGISTGSAAGSSLTWVVVVGGVGVVAAAGAAAVAMATAVALRRGAKGKNQQGDLLTQYVLQLSAEQVEVSPDLPARLGVAAWRVQGTGPPQPAPEAALRIIVQPPTAGLQVTPSAGHGNLQAAISVGDKPSVSAASLLIVGDAAGVRVTASVAVRIANQRYVLEVS